jgi:hypothetical protein
LTAKEIFKKHYGEGHVQYALSLNNLSDVLRDLGDYEGAKKGFLTAKEIIKKHYGEGHVQYA